jgi:bifunctional UDP-N-acetylglucosamine pyrophosphorylase/glucosamine-1-phosphate N-acetyltransferase
MSNSNLAIVILAAGKGSRMKSSVPKVMHKIAGRPMLGWLIDRCERLNPDKIIVVTAPDMDDVVAEAEVGDHIVAFQATQKGTGDAVKPALEHLKDFKGRVLILLGDEPFLNVDVLKNMIEYKGGIAAMAINVSDPTGLGRMITGEDGFLKSIVEDKDCDEQQKKIKICNSGNYCIPSEKLESWINEITNDNAQNEYILTDLPEIAARDGVKTKIFNVDVKISWGINNRVQLAAHEKLAQQRLRQSAMESGVTMIDPETVTLSWDTEFGKDVVIEPNVFIGPWSSIEDNVTIHAFSYIEGAIIEDGAEVGPYARIRPKSVICEGASVGNFIEVNRSVIKAGAKAKHLSYLGDVTIGEDSNIGAGTVIANYDGYFKHKSTIGKNVFIGSNSTIISPVEIGDSAMVAAGSNINKDINENAMAIGRSRQENHSGWATQYRIMKREKKLQEED